MAKRSDATSHWHQVGRRTEEILNVRGEVTRHRGRLAGMIDTVGQTLANPVLFLALVAGHLLWVLLNLRIFPYEPWDPYPFPLLATITSAEAPFLALLVLMRQMRDSRVEELREEIDLQVSLHLERQMTMLLRLIDEVQDKLQIQTQQDRETLERMKEDLDPERLMESLRRHLAELEGRDGTSA